MIFQLIWHWLLQLHRSNSLPMPLVSTRRYSEDIVPDSDLAAKKPCRLWLKRWDMWSRRPARTQRRRTLEMTGRGEIGRWFSTRSLFPFLKMGTIFASFHSSGKMPSRKDLLNSMVRDENRSPDRTVPDHVIQQIFAARHFSRTLETRE